MSATGALPVNVTAAGAEALDRAERLLAGVEGGARRAVDSALRKAAARLRRSSARAVRERYALSTTAIRDNENVTVSYSYYGGAQVSVRFGGRRIPLYRFDGVTPTEPTPDSGRRVPVWMGEDGWKTLSPGVQAAGHVLKSTTPKKLNEAFTARMKSGHVGVFERTGGRTSNDRDELRELYGPAVPQMLGSEEVREKLASEAMTGIEKDVDDAVVRILSGGM